jgi:hypothetical protein
MESGRSSDNGEAVRSFGNPGLGILELLAVWRVAHQMIRLR